MKTINTRQMVLSALFTALITIGALLKLQIFTIPFTLQFLFVMLAGILLGPKWGSLSVILYIMIGLLGFPVFSGGGGIGYILKPSFGYILGFYFAALIIGSLAGPNSKAGIKKTLLASVLGLLVIDVLGAIYWYILAATAMGTPIEIGHAIYYGCLVFIPKDLVFCLLGSVVGVRTNAILNKFNYGEIS